MSEKVAVAPSLVIVVVSVTLKTRVFVLPAMVNVFAEASTAETVPRNGIARAFFVSEELLVVVDLALLLAAGDAVGEAVGAASFFLVAARLVPAPQNAIAATQTPVMSCVFS